MSKPNESPFRAGTPGLYDTHMHTPLCGHATGDPEDYARRGYERGLTGIIMTDHSPAPDGFSAHVRMPDSEFPRYLEMVARAKSVWAGRIDVRLGLESDWFPGMTAWLEKLHARADFDFIIGSVHPQINEYRERYYTGNALEFMRGYFGHLADAAETGLFDSISHPDLVKNLFPSQWSFGIVKDAICKALDRIAKTGVAMELNTSGLEKAIQEMNPGPLMLREMRIRNIPVVVGSDSHVPRRVSDDFEDAFAHLLNAGYTTTNIFLGRKRIELPIAASKAQLKKLK